VSDKLSSNINKFGSGRACDKWLSSLNWQIDFYRRSNKRKRVDSEFDWEWLDRISKKGICGIAKSMISETLRWFSIKNAGSIQEWLNANADLLWDARNLLEDDLSKLFFDNVLTLHCSDYHQFFFPRIYFEDFVSIVSENPFLSNELPQDYLGLPLREFILDLHTQRNVPPVTVISTKLQINLLNKYRQYFMQRNMINFNPSAGDVVFDCGACIGDISMLFAGLVGERGEVHLFDPVPLHTRYCQLQSSMNPSLSKIFRINAKAVGDITRDFMGEKNDSDEIRPGGLSVDSFTMTTLDDYAEVKDIKRVNLIKMDIEGAEMSALKGASKIIRKFKPMLAISAYHKPEDLWQIPIKIKELNVKYKIFFGHHSPLQWESVYYAL